MDLILYPNAEQIAEEPYALLSDAGLNRIKFICQWLQQQDEHIPDVYLKTPLSPAHQPAFISWAASLAASIPAAFYCMIPAAAMNTDLLARLENAQLGHVIITDAASMADINHAAAMAGQHPAMRFSMWMEPVADTGNYRLRRVLKAANIEPVDMPLFGSAKGTAYVAQQSELPEQYLQHSYCEIAKATLVIDEHGKVMFCPSIGCTGGVNMNIFNHGPEQILIQKGRWIHQAGKLPLCATCDYKGRFEWKQTTHTRIGQLLQTGYALKGKAPWTPFDCTSIQQFDWSALPESELEEQLAAFEQRLRHWSHLAGRLATSYSEAPQVSVETPAFKGGWLIPCIESVLYQTSHRWTFYLVWDGGDQLSHRILTILKSLDHPKLKVFFSENRGIARSRHFLSAQSSEAYILPLDDDDMLAPTAIEDFLEEAATKPWSGIIRARRRFIDECGQLVDMDEWFPFENRNYQHGMIRDLHNHCQPALMRREAYDATAGWEGFPDFFYAGEDCDIYLKLEEKGSIELFDKVLYFYRLNPRRTSHELKPEGAYEMWRRLADKTIARIGLPVKRTNERPPFDYERLPAAPLQKEMIDFVIPFYEADEAELDYAQGRPLPLLKPAYFELLGHNSFIQKISGELVYAHRVVMLFSSKKIAEGCLKIDIRHAGTGELIATGEHYWKGRHEIAKAVSFSLQQKASPQEGQHIIELSFIPARRNYGTIEVLYYEPEEPKLIARFFKQANGYSRKVLDRCLASLKKAGIANDAIHIIDQKNSSSVNRNLGFSMTRRPLVCFLDDDVEIMPGNTFGQLLEVMEQTGADIIGPRLVTPAGKIFCADPFFNEGFRPVPKGIGEDDDGRYQYTATVQWLPSTLMLLKREVITAINGFDEGYAGSQMEDVDLCLKARQRDFKCVYAGTVSAIHYNNQRNDQFAENFERFLLKWTSHKHLLTH